LGTVELQRRGILANLLDLRVRLGVFDTGLLPVPADERTLPCGEEEGARANEEHKAKAIVSSHQLKVQNLSRGAKWDTGIE
jgi:hypothetical protein